MSNKTKKKPSTKKTTSQKVEEATKAVEAAVEATSPEAEATPVALQDLKIGYVVGLTEEGRFVFDLFGKNKGLVELLGIHQHAKRKVDQVYNDQNMSGDRLLHEIGRAVASIAQRLDGPNTTENIVVPEESGTEDTVTAG